MKLPVVVIGIGEIGSVVARGLLRCGHPVFPVTRRQPLAQAAQEYPLAEAVVLAVAEADLQNTLLDMPGVWRSRLVLLQNELLPRDWQRHELSNPTIASIWFEKKVGQDVKVLLPTPVHGPHAALMTNVFEALKIPARNIDDTSEMLYELVRKNVYILTSNIAGLMTGGTVSTLWQQHRAFAIDVANDVISLQEKLAAHAFPRERLIAGMVEGFDGDPEHKCMGRTAPGRLQRALALAQEFSLTVPTLRDIATRLEKALSAK
jgi:hypothetical protein